MKRLILALLLALPIFAQAGYCKAPDASYIHAGRIGAGGVNASHERV
mgnify:CR=1 FL=1